MAPTEATLLSTFLFSPASLQNIISFEAFTNLFPEPHRSNPHIRHLYHELEQMRDQSIENVKKNVDQEIKRGERQRRQITRAREQAALGGAANISSGVLGVQNTAS